MSTHTADQAAMRTDRPAAYEDDRGAGWMVFAGTIVLVLGVLNTIYGIAAISDSKFFVHGTNYVFSNLNTYGWIALCLGVAQVLVGFGIFAQNQFARWTGVFVLSLNAIVQMVYIPASPFLAISLLAMDIIAIYGLAAYGGRLERA